LAAHAGIFTVMRVPETHAMLRTAPPQVEQVSMSMPNTRFRRCVQVIVARRSAGVGSSDSTGVAGWPPRQAALILFGRFPLRRKCGFHCHIE
jgi:hypothetical protein